MLTYQTITQQHVDKLAELGEAADRAANDIQLRDDVPIMESVKAYNAALADIGCLAHGVLPELMQLMRSRTGG